MRSVSTSKVAEAETLSDESLHTPSHELISSEAESGATRLPGVRPRENDGAAAHDSRIKLSKSPWSLADSRLTTLFGWTFAAFLLRFVLLWRLEHVISPDGVAYVELGQNLIRGNFHQGLSTYFPPLYPLLVGFSSLFFGDAEFAGRMVSVVAGSLLVIPAYALINNWYGERTARLGACLIALHPVLVYYSTVLLTESIYTLLFTCGVLAGWSALSGGRARTHALAGALFGACYLLKPEAAGFLLLLLIPILCAKLFRPSVSYKISVRNTLLLWAGFLLLALPYLIYLRSETGAWTISGKFAGHLWQGTRAVGESQLPAATLMPDLTTAAVQLTKALRSEFELFNLIFPTPFIIFAGLGLFRSRWTSARGHRELYLASFIAATLVGYAVTLPNIRFLVPLLPLLLCWVAKGIIEFEEWTIETLRRPGRTNRFFPRARKLLVPFIITGLLLSMLPLFVYLVRGDKWSDYYGQKHAALWIKEQKPESTPVIMSTVQVASFYARGRHVPLFEEDYSTLIARARREHVDYIIINERNVKHMSLRTLLDEQNQHTELRLAHSIFDAPGHKILVYALTNNEKDTQ